MDKSPKIIKLLVDTREQDPLEFTNYENVATSTDTLPCGDYTMYSHDQPKDDNSIIIERKANTQELLGNLGKRWDAFKVQLTKMQEYKHKQIVVCGPENIEYLYSREFTKLSPNFFYKRLGDIYLNYGIPTIFLPDRDAVENYLFRLFTNIVRKDE